MPAFPVHPEDVIDASHTEALSIEHMLGLGIMGEGHTLLHGAHDLGFARQLFLDRCLRTRGDAQC